MNKNLLAKLLWDKLRLVACSTKLNAHFIVGLNLKDLKEAIKLISDQELNEVKNDSNA